MERIIFTDQALADLRFWQKSGDIIILKRIRQLIEAIQVDPFDGIGKPEALKHNFSGHWSRRINQEHRLIYQVKEEHILIVSLRFHYKR